MGSVQSIDRMFTILEFIANSPNGMGISEISEVIGLHKSTVHRLVTSLIENGYIYQMENTKYKVTYKMYELGSKVLKDINIIDAARKEITKLAEEVKEVIHLVVRNQNEIVYIDKQNPTSNSSIMGSSIGSSAPMYCTSVGKAMLFEAKECEINKVWKESVIVKKTDKTIINLNEFQKEIILSKKRGFSLDNEENELGIICVGAPIYDYKNGIIAAISLSGPTTRVKYENIHIYAKPLVRVAKKISHNMGYLGE